MYLNECFVVLESQCCKNVTTTHFFAPTLLAVHSDAALTVGCVKVLQAFKVAPGDRVNVFRYENGKLGVSAILKDLGVKVTDGNVARGSCEDGKVMVRMRFLQDQEQSSLIDYLVEPPPTTSCIPVNTLTVIEVGQRVKLAYSKEGVFGVFATEREWYELLGVKDCIKCF